MLRDMQERLMRLARSRLEAQLRARGHSNAAVDEAVRSLRESVAARAGAARRRSGVQIVAIGPGRVELLPLEVPLAGAHEVTVELSSTAVSVGTERAQYLRLPNAQLAFPYRPGYSGAGRVVAAGSNVSLKEGALVAVPRVAHMSVATVGAASAYAVPPGVAAEDAALVYLAMIAGYGLRRAAIEPGAALGIVGYGTIGALAHRLAVARGLGPTTVIAASGKREALARSGGADAFVLAGKSVAQLELPVVIEATGDPTAFATAIADCAPGGRIVLLGSPRGAAEFPYDEVRRKQLELVGAHISALATEVRRGGGDPFRELAEEFLDGLAESRLQVRDLVNVVADPREPSVLYRRLALDPSLLGARFDWTLVPDEERSRRTRLFSRPQLAVAGLDPDTPIAVSTVSALPRTRPTGSAFRVGLLGCGEIGAQNARAIAEAEGVKLSACFDPADALAQDVSTRFGGRVCRTAEELLGSGLDAVLVATPHHLHAPLALEAISAGLHVMVEKPLALNTAEAQRLVAAADAGGVLLSTCFPYRYEAHIAAARRYVEEGLVGDPSGILVTYASDKPPSYWFGGYSSRSVTPWRASRRQAGGGVVVMNLCHYLDLVRYVGQVEAETVVATIDRADAEDVVEDTAAAAVTYANGAVGSVFGCAAARGAAFSELRLWGDSGQLVLEPNPRLYTLRAASGVTAGRWHELPAPGPENVRSIYVERFAAAARTGTPPDVTPQDGLVIQALMDAVYESAARGEAVRPAELLQPAVA
jgi:2-desacetyl-2-hydroxyethyl bacteriochlorophyllide A dehydrogenase